MLGLISHSIRPNGLWALFSRPDRGRPTLHGWWAPVAQCYKGKVGAEARRRGSPCRQSSHRHPNPRPDLEKGRCQRQEAPPTPTTPPQRTRRRQGRHCTNSSLHRTSLPARRWRPSTKPRPELRPLRLSMVCYLSTPFSLSLCESRTPILLLCIPI